MLKPNHYRKAYKQAKFFERHQKAVAAKIVVRNATSDLSLFEKLYVKFFA